MSCFETEHSINAEAVYTALPSFLAPVAEEDDEEDWVIEAEPGFEPLNLPLQPGCTPWQIEQDGRLAAVRALEAQDEPEL